MMLRATFLLPFFALAVAAVAGWETTPPDDGESGLETDQAPLAAWEKAEQAVAEAAKHVASQLKDDSADPGAGTEPAKKAAGSEKEKLRRAARQRGLADGLDRLQEDASLAKKELAPAKREAVKLEGLEEEARRLRAVRAYDKLQEKEAQKRANAAENEGGKYRKRARLLKQRLNEVRRQLRVARRLEHTYAATGRALLAGARSVEKVSNASDASAQQMLDEALEAERRSSALFKQARDVAAETKKRLFKKALGELEDARPKALEKAFDEAFSGAHSALGVASSSPEKQPAESPEPRAKPDEQQSSYDEAFDSRGLEAVTSESLDAADALSAQKSPSAAAVAAKDEAAGAAGDEAADEGDLEHESVYG